MKFKKAYHLPPQVELIVDQMQQNCFTSAFTNIIETEVSQREARNFFERQKWTQMPVLNSNFHFQSEIWQKKKG